ncbi:hypothetical protein BDV06DRAFT_221592 [Aspergillus oleicola]
MGDDRMGQYKITYKVKDKVDPTVELDFSKPQRTSRYANPQTQDWVKGTQQDELVDDALQNPNWQWHDPKDPTTGTLSDNVFRLLNDTYFQSYKTFASTKKEPGQTPTESLSLEMIHNNLHQWSGGGGRDKNNIPADGHMANVPVASFDPIFWMHHRNVDRLFAIWQYLNPHSWLTPDDDPKPTDRLQPFHRDEQGTVYTSDDTRPWKRFGYTYPELVDGITKDDLRKVIAQKYGKSVSKLKEARSVDSGVTEHEFQDYIINVQYDRYALDGHPYTINFFLKIDDEHVYKLSQVFNFSAEGDGTCPNCEAQRREGVLSTGQVPISIPLHKVMRQEESLVKGVPYLSGTSPGLHFTLGSC